MKLFNKHSTAMFVLGAALLLMTSASRGGSIFDDDYTPPKHADAAPDQPAPTPPVTPAVPDPANPGPAVSRPPDVPTPTPANPPDNTAHRGLPDKTSRAKCRKLFEEVYATELKDRSPVGRRSLAQKLLDEAAKNPQGSPDRYMLLIGAMEAAEEGQNLPLCFDAVQQMADGYDVDALATKVDAATKTFAGRPSPALGNADTVGALREAVDVLISDDYFGTAAHIELVLQRALAAVSDPALKTELKNQSREVAAYRDGRAKIAPALEKLKTSPDDPAANFAVGSFLCFQRGKWNLGLPLLAKSSDAHLKDLATAELSGAADADAKIKLADSWFAAAAKLSTPDRPKAMQHAADIYRSAEAGVTDLKRLAIEKQLAKIPRAAGLRRVNLLKTFDPATCVVSGSWRMQDGELACDPADFGRVLFAYQPPEEYDFRVSFTLVSEPNGIAQLCSSAGHQFTYVFAEWGNTISAIETVNGKDGVDNKTAIKKDRWLTAGHRYTSMVKVRKTGVEAYLDGQLITSLKTDYSDMGVRPGWQLPRSDVVGLGIYRNALRFDAIEIIEITGEGKLVPGK